MVRLIFSQSFVKVPKLVRGFTIIPLSVMFRQTIKSHKDYQVILNRFIKVKESRFWVSVTQNQVARAVKILSEVL